MVALGMSKGISDPEVIILSQQLEELLNQYYRQSSGKNKDSKENAVD